MNIEDLVNRIILLIEQCYFDSFINGILIELLGNLRIDRSQWSVITRKIQESDVPPSPKVIESLFLQALRYDELSADLDEFVYSVPHCQDKNIRQFKVEFAPFWK